MQNVIFGALGVLLVLGLLALGFFMGWKGWELWTRHTTRAVEQEISEQERRAFLAQQKAFDDLLGYNAETAYGLNRGLEELEREGGEDE